MQIRDTSFGQRFNRFMEKLDGERPTAEAVGYENSNDPTNHIVRNTIANKVVSVAAESGLAALIGLGVVAGGPALVTGGILLTAARLIASFGSGLADHYQLSHVLGKSALRTFGVVAAGVGLALTAPAALPVALGALAAFDAVQLAMTPTNPLAKP